MRKCDDYADEKEDDEVYVTRNDDLKLSDDNNADEMLEMGE